ncbi:MAG: hypothetical protein WC551_02415 [Patescibacteria group bacterium]
MEKTNIRDLAEGLARGIDKRNGPKHDIAYRQFMRRQISLTDAGEVGPEEVRAALRAMGPNLPSRIKEWLDRNLFRMDGLDDLIDIFWKISVAAVPVKNRHVAHYANLKAYQSLVRVLYDEFIWNLMRSNSSPLAVTQGAVYGRVVQSFNAQILAHFSCHSWRPTANSVDAKIDRAIDELFEAESPPGEIGSKIEDIQPLEAIKDGQRPQLIVLKSPVEPTATEDKPAVPVESIQDIQGDIERLRRQIGMLNATLQLKFKRLQQLVYLGDEESAIRDPKWEDILFSPWHMTELSWFLSQIPRDKTAVAQREVAMAVSWEKKVPSITRFRKILANILKRHTGN